MKFLYEENDTVVFGNVAFIPDDMLMVDAATDNEQYSPEYRARLEYHQQNRSTFVVTEVDDGGETIYVKGVHNKEVYCFMPEAFKPTRHTLDKLLATLIN